jgi:hypothetical protein
MDSKSERQEAAQAVLARSAQQKRIEKEGGQDGRRRGKEALPVWERKGGEVLRSGPVIKPDQRLRELLFWSGRGSTRVNHN